MMEIEYSVLRKKENPAQRFLQRIKQAETRGLQIRPGQSIDERTLSQFERTGVQVASGFTPASGNLSDSEHKALREKIFSGYDRDKRTDELREKLRAKLELEEKLRPFHGWVNEEKKDNYIYLK